MGNSLQRIENYFQTNINMMKIKYLFFLIILVYVSSSVTAQDLCLLKTFNINGREETKKVKIVQKSEYTYSGKLKIFSKKKPQVLLSPALIIFMQYHIHMMNMEG